MALWKVVLAESMVPHLPELAPAAGSNLSELIFVKRAVSYLFEVYRKRNFFKRTLGKAPFPDILQRFWELYIPQILTAVECTILDSFKRGW